MEQNEPIVLHLFSLVFGHECRLEDDRESLGDWTSLRHLQLVLAMEEQFELEIDPEIVPDLRSVRDFVALAGTRSRK